MATKNLHERIKILIGHFCDGSLSAFAERIQMKQSTLQRLITSGDTKNLRKYVENILNTFTTVREEWLRNGDGEMLRSAAKTEGSRVQELEEHIKELKYTIELQKQLLEATGNLAAETVNGTASAAPLPPSKTDRS